MAVAWHKMPLLVVMLGLFMIAGTGLLARVQREAHTERLLACLKTHEPRVQEARFALWTAWGKHAAELDMPSTTEANKAAVRDAQAELDEAQRLVDTCFVGIER
jgi:hypothetical protein